MAEVVNDLNHTNPVTGRPNQARWWCRLAVSLVLVTACLAAYWLNASLSRQSLEGTVQLWVPPESLNIGTVWETDHFEWVLPIENREETPLEVESFSTSCNCISVEANRSFVLEPGARRELRLQIDLHSQLKSTGEVSIHLLPRLKVKRGDSLAKKFLPEWKISGHVRRVLAFDRDVYLRRHSELSQPLPLRAIPIEVLVPLESLAAECDAQGWGASVKQGEGGNAVLQLTQPSPLPLGAFKGTVNLKPVLKGGERLPAQRMRFTGKIVPDVEAVPPAVQVGGRRLGETFEDVVVLRSMTGQAFSVLGADVEGDGLAVEPIEGGRLFQIRQKVCKAGSQSNRVLLHVQSAGREVALTVPVSYTGLERP